MSQAWMTQARRRMARSNRIGEGQSLARWEAWQAYGEWFEALPWDWYATFTLHEGSTVDYLRRRHRKWSAEMHREHGQQLRQAFAIECQRNGTPHGHALIHGVTVGADPFHAMAIWERIAGRHLEADGKSAFQPVFARIFPYSGAGGAASYCAKYVTKDGDIDLIGPWPRFSRSIQEEFKF
jgi:hypothetical protein